MQDFKTSLHHTQAEVDELKRINCQQRLDNIQKNVDSLLDKVDDLENRSRRNNLCFEGIDEVNKFETWEQSEEKLKQVLNDHLEIEPDEVVIERAHRVGKKVPDKPRPIIAKFLNYKDKDKIWNNRKKFKGTNVMVREEFSERISQKRKDLIPKMISVRKEGKIAYLRYDKLIIRERRFPPLPRPQFIMSTGPPGYNTMENQYSSAYMPTVNDQLHPAVDDHADNNDNSS